MGRKRSRTPSETQENESIDMVSGYEKSREERIKQNLERMQKLGILNLALQLKSPKKTSTRTATHSTPRTHFSASTLPPLGPTRRSCRLQNASPVSYCEVDVSKGKSLDSLDYLTRLECSRPEVYTEEHEKLLGSTEKCWTLFVDGYGKDGKRIYDQVNGKSCHQCRQKTLGHRTHCSKCKMGQGQFCGDCLYIRYGEHVLEAKQNANWICPVCRGICNCSLCRHAKGWPPTGSLYRKISALGYKSVAHFLVRTRRENAESDDIKTKVPLSAKRSLPFVETETASTFVETSDSNSNPQGLIDKNPEEAKLLKISTKDIHEKTHHSVNALSNCKLVLENKIEIIGKREIAFDEAPDCQGSPEPEIAEPKQEVKIGKEKRIELAVEKELSNGNVMKITDEDAAFSNSEISDLSCGPTSAVRPVQDDDKLQKPIAYVEKKVHSDDLVANGIVGRLGLSQNDNNKHEEEVNVSTVGTSKPQTGESSLELILSDDPKDVIVVKEEEIEITPTSKNDNNKHEEEEVNGSTVGNTKYQNGKSSLELILSNDPKDVIEEDKIEKTPISKKKRCRASEPVADSIAGRLRQRRPRIN